VSDETSDPDFDDINDDINDDNEDVIDDVQGSIAQTRARLAEVPAEIIITNHVMGLYELGAIHLSANPPDLRQAALAIDAVACLVDGLGLRLGEDAATMQDALNNIRLAFVQIKGQMTAGQDESPEQTETA
jgi:hypothetical protein